MAANIKPSTSATTGGSLEEVRNSMNAASASRVSKFLAKPSVFRGERKDTANPMVWLNAMERIYNGMSFTDEEMIIVLASYFAGPAAIWWNVIEPQVQTWTDFVLQFTIQYASGAQKDEWWEELENLHQTINQSVDDVKFRIMELSTLLSVTDSTKIRYFMRAIHKPIALRVSDVNPSLTNWEEVTASAKRIEMNDNKYGNGVLNKKQDQVQNIVMASNDTGYNYGAVERVGRTGDTGSVVSLNSLASTVERLCIGFDALQLSLNTASNGGSVHSTNHVRIVEPTPVITNNDRRCYNCQETGHIAPYCNKPRVPRRVQPVYSGGGNGHQNEQERTPASGSNAIPIGDNSDSNVMGKGEGRY